MEVLNNLTVLKKRAGREKGETRKVVCRENCANLRVVRVRNKVRIVMASKNGSRKLK